MLSKLTRLSLLILLLALPGQAAQADESLSAAYGAILRGDYEAGQAQLVRLREQGVSATDVAEVEGWLAAYRQAIDSRAAVKAETFAWNTEQAKKALADQEVYLALCFAERAVHYAPNEEAYSAEPWIQDLTTKAERKAEQLKTEHRWSKVHAYYMLLKYIHSNDKRFKELQKEAGRQARLQILYKDEEKLQQQIEDVKKDLLEVAVRQIHRNYYQEPDFKRMATGALNSLIALSKTEKLYDHLHGLGNPDTRDYFIKALERLLESVRVEERYNYKDLNKLFRSICFHNTESVELPEGLLVVEFLTGAVDELDDYTSMIWPVNAADFDKMMMGGFEGVGIQLQVDERTGRLKVVTPLEDSPALEAGIQPGDLIVEVDDQSTRGWSTEDAVRNIMGPAGTPVVLTMFRPSTGQRIPFKLHRRKIILRTVRGLSRLEDDAQNWNYMLDDQAGIACVRVTGFHPDTHEELVKALRTARKQGMRGLILDLRHNPGGLLDVAIHMVSTFLHKGEVVSTSGRRESRTSIRVTEEPFVLDVPIVVLVNDGSASASEILAGALQDHQRGIVLGERTFGKGSVQRVMPLGPKARLKLTTALYYLPNGTSPHKAPDAETWGVQPDWEVKLTPKEFRRVLKSESESYIIHNEDEPDVAANQEDREKALDALKDDEDDEDDEPPLLTDEQIEQLDADPVEALDSDPQMETALLLLRVKLAGDLPWPRQLAAKTKD